MRLLGRRLFLLAMVGFAFGGCKKKDEEPGVLRGSGVQTTKTREIAPFSRLEVGGRVQASVTFSGLRPMEIKGDDNLVGHVRARIEKGTMLIDTDTKVKTKMPLEVRLVVPSLESVTASGASRIHLQGLVAKNFEASASVAGVVVVEGTADTLLLSGSGAGELDFTKVPCRSAKVTLVKGATARVGYLEELEVHLSDATRVFYEGEPNIKKDIKRPAFLVKRR